MEKRPELYLIEEPKVPVSNVVHFSGIRPHGPAVARKVGPPWPHQVDWRTFLRPVKK